MTSSSRRSTAGADALQGDLHHRSTSPSSVHIARSSTPSKTLSVSFASPSTFGWCRPSHARGRRTTMCFPTTDAGSVISTKAPPVRFASSARSLPILDRRFAQDRARLTCICAPSTHPGSFRCSLHRDPRFDRHRAASAGSSPSNRLNAFRSATANSLIRAGAADGECMRRALAALTRSSSHQERRRADSRAGPTRLSVMSKADDG
ncbi:hypothetical protein Cni_G00301 [Canna indica]|uniref:Uncharacterized protein n=1 Tax=Canna indica TaxID=4628 RepID=A0AAQ3JM84_9LILI|nr:hypothetical protein Cni_G00301 [Canna indica]